MLRYSHALLLLLLAPVIVRAEDWPQWRGPNRDNAITGFVVPKTWPAKLTQKWKTTVGEGVASPALVGDKIYAFGRIGGDEVLSCLEADTGKEVWKDKYAGGTVSGIAGGFKGPRGSVAVADGKVLAFGVGGQVSCWDAKTGKLDWRKETKAVPKFSTSCSPMIGDGLCIVHTGAQGRGELVAYEIKTGDAKWKWSGDGPSYGSPVLATIGDVKQVVVLTDSNLVGIGATDGKLLWKKSLITGRYQTCTPIVYGSTVICAGNAIEIEKGKETFEAKSIWKEHAPHNYCSPTIKGEYIYGFSGQGRGGSKLYCQEAKTGKLVWEDSATRGECGMVLDAGDVMIALSSDSNLLIFKPGGKEYTEVMKYKVSETGTWTVPIVVGKKIYVKDRDSVILWSLE